MIKSRFLLPIIFTLIVVALFSSCEPSSSPETQDKTGTLIIRVGEEEGERSIDWEPDVLMEIDYYEITGIGPEGRTFDAIKAVLGDTVVIPNLREGSWDIIVTGLNEDDQAIGEGIESVTILAGREVEKRIVVTEFTGEGTFSLEVNWPEIEISDPNILVTLKKTTGSDLLEYSFTSEDSGGSATLLEEIEAGYYLLTVSIYDGPTDNINNKLTGVSGTIRVLANYTTFGSFTFIEDDLRGFGDVEISISAGLSIPFKLTLSQDRDKVWEGVPITFTATPTTEGEFTYYWYLNGELIEGENSNTLQLETTLPYGKHNVGVAANRQGVLASKLTSFLVIEEPSTYFTVSLFEEGTNNLVQQFDLNFTVPNFANLYGRDFPIDAEDFKPLAFKFIVYEEEGEIIEEFIINGFNKVFEDGVFISGTMIEDFTLITVYIKDFSGVGVYQFYSDEIGLGSALFGLMTSQAEIVGHPSLGMLSSDYNEEGGTIEIVELGEVGGYVKGEIEIQKVPMFFYDDSYKYFDLRGEFSLIRGEDLVLTQKTIAFIYEGDNQITKSVLAGKDNGGVLREAAQECMAKASIEGEITGWSLEEINGEKAYDVYDSFIVPNSDLTLYAVWKDN